MSTSTEGENLRTGIGYKSTETKIKLRLYTHGDPLPVHNHLRTTISKSGPTQIPLVVAKGEESFTPMFCQLVVLSTNLLRDLVYSTQKLVLSTRPSLCDARLNVGT